LPKNIARRLQEIAGGGGDPELSRLITEHASDAIFLLDEQGRTTFANPSAIEMFGWTLDELQGEKLHDLVHFRRPDGSPFPMSDCPLGNVFRTGESLKLHEDLFYHRSGRPVPVACSNAAIALCDQFIGGVLIVRDITERLESQRNQQLLFDELNHRVKNMLAVVQAIAGQSLKGPEYAEVRTALSGRLQALAAAQNLLTNGQGIAASMREIVAAATGSFGGAERIRLAGPDLPVAPRLATALSMALHELGTNAMKYGALSVDKGWVEIEWSEVAGNDGPALTLCWRETGGPPVVTPARRGFGSRMIEKLLTAETGAQSRIEFAATGLVAQLTAPMSRAQG